MADITFTSVVTISKGELKRTSSATQSISFVSSAPTAAAGIASIGFAAHEAIPMGDVSTAGFARFKNLDSTNFVQIGTDVAAAFVPSIKLKAGESFTIRLGTNAPYAKANTAAVQLDYEIFQD
jgi:hypothetical protein